MLPQVSERHLIGLRLEPLSQVWPILCQLWEVGGHRSAEVDQVELTIVDK
jgi:hypothetical protein